MGADAKKAIVVIPWPHGDAVSGAVRYAAFDCRNIGSIVVGFVFGPRKAIFFATVVGSFRRLD